MMDFIFKNTEQLFVRQENFCNFKKRMIFVN